MANTAAAGEAYRNVAGFRELEQTLKFRIPGDRQAGAGKRNPGTIAGLAYGCVRCAERPFLHARHDCAARAEHLRVYAVTIDAPIAESGAEFLQERSRPAHVKMGFARYTQFFKGRDGQPPGDIKVYAGSVRDVGPPVRDATPRIGQLGQQIARFLGQGMILAVARSVDPPYLSRR